MKNKSRAHGNKAKTSKPSPNNQSVPLTRNINLSYETWGKLQMIKTKLAFSDFDSVVSYLIVSWRKK